MMLTPAGELLVGRADDGNLYRFAIETEGTLGAPGWWSRSSRRCSTGTT